MSVPWFLVTMWHFLQTHQMLTVGGSGSHLCTSQKKGILSKSWATVPPARIHNFKVHLWIGPGSDECFLEGGFAALIQAINLWRAAATGSSKDFIHIISSWEGRSNLHLAHYILSFNIQLKWKLKESEDNQDTYPLQCAEAQRNIRKRESECIGELKMLF